MDTKGEQLVENEDYVCPNCGAVSTVKGLLDGCDYCNTFFKIDELFPKVTNYVENAYVCKNMTWCRKQVWDKTLKGTENGRTRDTG